MTKRIESDNDDIDLSDDFNRYSSRKEGEIATQNAVPVDVDGRGSQPNSAENVNDDTNYELSGDLQAKSTRQSTKKNVNTNGAVAGNSNKTTPTEQEQTPHKRKTKEPTAKQHINIISVPLSAVSTAAKDSVNMKGVNKNGKQTLEQKVSTQNDAQSDSLDSSEILNQSESVRNNVGGAVMKTNDSGNIIEKRTSELAVENEILKLEMVRMKERYAMMQKQMQQDVDIWKERYRCCKVKLEEMKKHPES